MKKIFFIFLLLSLFCPLIFFYTYLYPPELVSIDTALNSFAGQLQKKASEKNLKGYIASVEEIHGSQSDAIKNKIADINALLFAYKKWEVLIGEKEREEVKNKINLYINRWGNLDTASFSRLIKKEAKASASLKYYPQVFCEEISGKNNFCALTMNIVDFATKEKILSVSAQFTLPVYHAKMVGRQKVLKFGTCVSSGVFSLAFFTLIFLYSAEFVKKKKFQKNLPEILERLGTYFNQGHFIAAGKLVAQCISVLPENTDLLAFRERLEDYCGGNPKKAQVAYVEMLKLKRRFSEGNVFALKNEEQSQISALIPYSPDLRATYEKYLNITEEERRKKEREARKFFEKAKEMLKKMEVLQAVEVLKKALEEDPDFSDAGKLLCKIENVREKETFTLIPEKTGKEIIITSKDVLTFGRDAADIIISHNRISRPHLKIMMIGSKVIAEDLNSKNGSYHRGEKIVKTLVSDGDVVDLARAYRLCFHICMEKSKTSAAQGTLSEGRPPEPPTGEEETNGIYIEGDDRDFLICR